LGQKLTRRRRGSYGFRLVAFALGLRIGEQLWPPRQENPPTVGVDRNPLRATTARARIS
jgi:hypothetical protein